MRDSVISLHLQVRLLTAAHLFMSFWKGAFDGSVRGIAKLHSIEQSLMITFGRGYSNTGTQRRGRGSDGK